MSTSLAVLLAFAVTLPSAQASDRPVSSPQASTNLPVAVEPESTSEYAGQAGVGAYSGVILEPLDVIGDEGWLEQASGELGSGSGDTGTSQVAGASDESIWDHFLDTASDAAGW